MKGTEGNHIGNSQLQCPTALLVQNCTKKEFLSEFGTRSAALQEWHGASSNETTACLGVMHKFLLEVGDGKGRSIFTCCLLTLGTT